jgi:adenylate cyclase
LSRKLLWLQIVWLTLCGSGFVLTEAGSRYGLPALVQNKVFYPLDRVSSYLTDLRYAVRGPVPVKNPIVIVEIDEPSIEKLGRWPWRRDHVASVIDAIFEAGAKLVALDLFFSEEQVSIPEDLQDVLKKNNLGGLLLPFDYDGALEATIRKHRERLVLAWASESECRPMFSAEGYCPVTHPEALATHPKGFSKFSFAPDHQVAEAVAATTPLSSVTTLIPNLERFENAAKHSGFVNDYRDKDGLVRRTSLMTLVGGKPYSTLPLTLAQLWKNESLGVSINESGRLDALQWKHSDKSIGANALGVARINFRGKERSFPYVSVHDILMQSHRPQSGSEPSRDVASLSNVGLLDGAIVLLGITAIGLTKDVVATPFDATMPGVEVHANILDNLLSDDFLIDSRSQLPVFALVLLLVGTAVLILLSQRLEARPTLLLSVAVIAAVAAFDFLWAFPNGLNLNFAFHYASFAGAVVIGLAAKYIAEEYKRKFLREAFSKYVAPAVVDSLVKDPSQLSLGGRKEQVSVLFSDIRSFTSYSERMEPKLLSEFLNDYLGLQTEIVFAHGGTLDKYIGDAMMAFWGAPLKQPNHAALACQAVSALVQSLEKHKARWMERYGVPVRMGVGLHAGEVSVGNMGSARSFNYTVIGDNVNLSSRLEGATKYFGVTALTTRETLTLAKSQGPVIVPTRALMEVKVKGKQQNVELIELRGAPLKDSFIKEFEQAKQLFRKRQFKDARAYFLELSKKTDGPEPDGPCLALAEFSQTFDVSPPPPHWDGSWTLESK